MVALPAKLARLELIPCRERDLLRGGGHAQAARAMKLSRPASPARRGAACGASLAASLTVLSSPDTRVEPAPAGGGTRRDHRGAAHSC